MNSWRQIPTISLFLLAFSFPLNAMAFSASDEIVSVSVDEGQMVLKYSGIVRLDDRLTVTTDDEQLALDRTILSPGMQIRISTSGDKVTHITIESDLTFEDLEH